MIFLVFFKIIQHWILYITSESDYRTNYNEINMLRNQKKSNKDQQLFFTKFGIARLMVNRRI